MPSFDLIDDRIVEMASEAVRPRGRPDQIFVTTIPSSGESWVRRRFFDADLPNHEITFVAFDEVSKLSDAQLQAVKVFTGDMVRIARDKIAHIGIDMAGDDWQIEKAKRLGDATRKERDREREEATLPNASRELTNRKARRAAAAKSRRR